MFTWFRSPLMLPSSWRNEPDVCSEAAAELAYETTAADEDEDTDENDETAESDRMTVRLVTVTEAVDIQRIVYDPSVMLSYGAFHCLECGSQFYGGGPALHNTGCGSVDYSPCEYQFGPKQVERVKEVAAKYGPDEKWWGISLNMLRAQFPELLTDSKEAH